MDIQLDKYSITIYTEALSVLNHFTQRHKSQPEAGGIILGKILNERIHILKLSPPTELDKASRTNFQRHKLSAQIIINHEFYNSNQQITYLGEWHTHPENFPSPSSTDKKMIGDQYRNNIIHTDFIILLIKGIKDLYIGILDKQGLVSKNIVLEE